MSRTVKPLKPTVKKLALKRIGKARKLITMLARVKRLDNAQALAALDEMVVQLDRLAAGGDEQPDNDLI